MTYAPSPAARLRIERTIVLYPEKPAALLPVLHAIQEEVGYISPEAEAWVAAELGIPPLRVGEVLSFYTMFRRAPGGRHTIRVCRNLSCHLAGAEDLLSFIGRRLGIGPGETTPDGAFTLVTAECLGNCDRAPCLQIDGLDHGPVSLESAAALIEELKSPPIDDDRAWRLEAYLARGGYEAARKAVTAMTPEAVVAEVSRAMLRGRGGAGFPAGLKWGFVPRGGARPKYLCVNADEGEPGTFKDRHILLTDPHRLLEGMLIAAYAVGIAKAFIYVRGEYARLAAHLEEALGEARAAGFLGPRVFGTEFGLEAVVHPGAGAYICGEETALLESLEGRRGQPRVKPPFPALVGLFRSPTVVNNVETLASVPGILSRGADWFRERGLPEDGGTRLFSVSGAVRRPGLYELAVGTPLRTIVETHAGGPPEGRTIKAVVPGGLSAPILKPEEIDLPMDLDSLAKAGSMLGSAGIVVISDRTPILDVLHVTARFYAEESCGKCTPCRIGTRWILKVVERLRASGGGPEDLDLVVRLAEGIRGKTLCPLGDGAALPIRALVAKFRDELEQAVAR